MDMKLPLTPCYYNVAESLGYYRKRSLVVERVLYIWLNDGSFTTEEVPTYFDQRHRGHLNDVQHAKPLGWERDGFASFHDMDGKVYCSFAEGITFNARYELLSCQGDVGSIIAVGTPQTHGYFDIEVEIFYAYDSLSDGRIRYRRSSWSCVVDGIEGSRKYSFTRNCPMGCLMDNQLSLLVTQLESKCFSRSRVGDEYWASDGEDMMIRYRHVHSAYELVRHRIKDWVRDLKVLEPRPSGTLRLIKGAIAPLTPKYSFLLGEDSWFNGLMQQRDQSYWTGYLLNESYIRACESVPRMSENSISNLLEIGSFLATLLTKHRVEIPKSAADAWLQYRYVYSTTKLDIKEAISFFRRRADLNGLSKYTVHGNSSTVYKDTVVSCHCSFSIENKAVTAMQQLLNVLYEYGLSPNAYVLWDMIPFSFIADWFIPVGDILGRTVADLHLKQAFDISDVGYAISYTHIDECEDGTKVENRYYTRKYGATPPAYRGFYEFENVGATSKTVGYRILDVASLILG